MEYTDVLIIRKNGSEVKKFDAVVEEFNITSFELEELIEQGLPCHGCYFDFAIEGEGKK